MRISYKGVSDPTDKRITPHGFSATEDISLMAASRFMTGALVWSHFIYRDGFKDSAHALTSHAVVFDVDDGYPSLENAINNVFADYALIAGTTLNHGRKKDGYAARDRYRIVIPTERPMTIPEHREAYRQAWRRYEIGDKSQAAVARGWLPFKEIVAVNLDGDLWEVPDLSDLPKRKRYVEGSQPLPHALLDELKTAWPEGSANRYGGRNNQAFYWACRAARAGVALNTALRVFEQLNPTGADPGEFLRSIESAYRNERRLAKETKAPAMDAEALGNKLYG